MVCFGCRSAAAALAVCLALTCACVCVGEGWPGMEGAVGLTGGHAEPQRVRGSANLPPPRLRRRDSFQRVENVYLNVSILWRSRRRKP